MWQLRCDIPTKRQINFLLDKRKMLISCQTDSRVLCLSGPQLQNIKESLLWWFLQFGFQSGNSWWRQAQPNHCDPYDADQYVYYQDLNRWASTQVSWTSVRFYRRYLLHLTNSLLLSVCFFQSFNVICSVNVSYDMATWPGLWSIVTTTLIFLWVQPWILWGDIIVVTIVWMIHHNATDF